ncbi:MAG: phosphoribosylformylglycinamidine cyclo-ligase [Chloroflexota bacterium]|nr:phosphoribosylformylglycinamidine cyclo-ligase [Chloroflexota bacterium]
MASCGSGPAHPAKSGTTYRDAGVDVEAGNAAVGRLAALARTTFGGDRDAPLPIGRFAGSYRLPAGGDRLLVASADGVGTKLKLAFLLGGAAHARVGADLVNHCVDDVLAVGARSLFFLDYVAMGRLDPATLEAVVGGMATACRENGLALIGGETAEMPGFYADGEYDAAGFIVGEVAPEAVVDGSAVRPGDLLIGLPSVGLHTNGFSLARRIVGLSGEPECDRELLDRPLPGGTGESVGEALMRPHPSYLATVEPALARGIVRGMAHITGGGLVDNVPRMLPPGLAATFDTSTWDVPPIFDYLIDVGGVSPRERYQAFNMGLGFVLAVAPEDATGVLAAMVGSGARVVGRVVPRGGDDRGTVRGLFDDAADARHEGR